MKINLQQVDVSELEEDIDQIEKRGAKKEKKKEFSKITKRMVK